MVVPRRYSIPGIRANCSIFTNLLAGLRTKRTYIFFELGSLLAQLRWGAV